MNCVWVSSDFPNVLLIFCGSYFSLVCFPFSFTLRWIGSFVLLLHFPFLNFDFPFISSIPFLPSYHHLVLIDCLFLLCCTNYLALSRINRGNASTFFNHSFWAFLNVSWVNHSCCVFLHFLMLLYPNTILCSMSIVVARSANNMEPFVLHLIPMPIESNLANDRPRQIYFHTYPYKLLSY